jgi:hypothetical protein
VVFVRKAQRAAVTLSVKLPPKRIREKFLIIYELKGCQKAVDFLTEYYGVRRMRIVLDGRRVPRKCCGVYFENKACFKREGLKRRVVLHELYHHLVETKGLEVSIGKEEKEAELYAKSFI